MGIDIRVLCVGAAIVAALGCAPEAQTPETPPLTEPPAAVGTVEVTNYPLEWVVTRLAAPRVEVRFRAADAPDPAYWRPDADDVVAMQRADLIIVNGASYEAWLATVSLPTSRLVDTTAGLKDRLIPVAETVTHSHGTEGAHEHTGTAFTTWLDPTLLVEQAREVQVALGDRWPEHEALFAERMAGLVSDLEALDAEFQAATDGARERPVVFSHPVYQYLERRYGLVGDSVHLEPDVVLDAEQWAELDHLLGHRGASRMIWEAEPAEVTRIALAERGCQVAVVATCAVSPNEGDYLDVMRANADALARLFGDAR